MKTDLKDISFMKGAQIMGVDIFIINSNEYSIRTSLLKKTRKGLTLISNYNNINSFDELAKIVGNIPIILSFDGKGILHKKIPKNEDAEGLSQIIPGNQQELFCLQTYQIDKAFDYISIVRKEFIDSFLDELKSRKIKIVNFLLGPFSIDVLPIQNSQYPVFNQIVEVSNGRVTNIDKSENILFQNYIYNDLRIESGYLISYTNALYFFNKPKENFSECEYAITIKQEFLWAKLFKFSGWAALLLILSILLVNYIVFDHFRNKEELLKQEMILNSGYAAKLELLKKEFNAKNNLVKTSGILGFTRISFYVDKVVNSTPEEVRLKKLEFQPLQNKIKDGEEIFFHAALIKVEGFSASSISVNNWIDEIGSFNWVKNVEILKYSQKDFENPGEFTFTIELKK